MVASIDYIEKVVGMFADAAHANRQTATRTGNVIELTPEVATEVMITGDLHGNRRNFNLIRRIAALSQYPKRHLIIQEVCHGGPTYAENGGCMSHTVLEDVARLKTQFPEQVHFILGNHELAELADYPIQKNKQMLNLLFRLGLRQMYGDAAEKVRAAMFPFIRTAPLAVRVADGVFVAHSIPAGVDRGQFDASIFSRELDDEDFLERSALFELVWGRDYREENAQAFAELVGARLIIGGHEPCPEGFGTPNGVQVIVDCCGPKATYVMLPVGPKHEHEQVVDRIQRLG